LTMPVITPAADRTVRSYCTSLKISCGDCHSTWEEEAERVQLQSGPNLEMMYGQVANEPFL
jgi:hypothetical protein